MPEQLTGFNPGLRKTNRQRFTLTRFRTPTYVECLNEVLEEAVVGELSGLYHAGGPQKLSLFQIAQIVNLVGGYDPHLLIGCPRVEAGPIPPRAGNVTLNSDKLARAIGRVPFCHWPLLTEHLPSSRNGISARRICRRYVPTGGIVYIVARTIAG